MNAAAGRNASANGSSEPSSSDCTTLIGHVLERPARERGVRGVAQRIDADQEQHVDLAVGAGPQDRVRVAAGLAVHDRAPDGLDIVRPSPSVRAAGQQRGCTPARSAPRSFARRVT